MAGTMRTALGLLCAAALISMPTLQAAPVHQDTVMVAIAPDPTANVPDGNLPDRAHVARHGLGRGGPAVAEAADTEAATVQTTSAEVPDNGTWLWPTPSRLITSPFGFRTDPLDGSVAFHSGTDLGDPCGTVVGTTRPGVVTFAGPAGGYGLRVVVDHGGGFWSAYSHMQQISVQVGDALTQSHAIGQVGTTGRSTGCHLHFEILINGGFTDPMPYLTGNPVANPTTFGNGNIVAAPVSTPEASSPSATPSVPSASADPCTVSTDPQDAIDSGGLIPVPGLPGSSGANPCPTPTTPSPSSSATPSAPSSSSTPSASDASTPTSNPSSSGTTPSSPPPSDPTSGGSTGEPSASAGPSTPAPSAEPSATPSEEPSEVLPQASPTAAPSSGDWESPESSPFEEEPTPQD